jgi:eukaryotic-like serine/threonine-protein kinase
MNPLGQLKAEHLVHRLRGALQLGETELHKVEDELAAMEPPQLGPILRCLAHGEARGPALRVLERLLRPETVGALVEALSSPNPTIASGVAQVLSRSPSFDASSLVPHLAAARPSRPTLESILCAHASKLPPRCLMQVFPRLDKEGQAVVFRLLDKTDNASILPDLVGLLEHDDWWVRVNVARLVSTRTEPQLVQALILRLQDAHKGVRYECVCSLHRMRAAEATPAIVSCLRDPDYKVQSAAIDTLMEIADASAVPHLLEVLTDESEYVRRGAVEVLNEVATPEAIQDLVRALRDVDWWVRVRAADALGALGGEKVVDAVVGLLGDTDDFIRRHAVEILNSVPSTGAAKALIGALDDPDWWVRERAIDALGKAGAPEAVEPLLAIMDSDPGTVTLCARALGAIGDPRAVRPLADLVESDREEVRHEAIEALKTLLAAGLPDEERSLVQAAIGRIHRASTPSPSHCSPLGAVRQRAWNGETRQAIASPDLAAGARLSDGRPMSIVATSRPEPAPVHADTPRPPQYTDFTDLLPDTLLLDRYQVRQKIGKGGFGAIYLVHDGMIQEDLILKILRPQLSADETALRRFIRELKLTRRITHPNVIRLHDFMDLGGAHAVSMEYFRSRDLGRVLVEEGRLSVRRALEVVSQACAGLAAAHAEQVIHRDLKPANILLNDKDELKIVDFGLATGQLLQESRLTNSGLLIGTPEYMAPEQISGDGVDGRADIYSLGILTYELLSGVRPFSADSPVKVLFLHLEGDAAPLRQLAPEVPEGVERLVTAAMQRNAADRPASMDALRLMITEELAALGPAA